MSKPAVFELKNISKSFMQGENKIDVLSKFSLSLKAGEMVALCGPSGSGKSTLLQIAGLLDRADQGQVLLEGQDVSGFNERQQTKLRLNKIGFVYQFHHLLPEFSAIENIAMPLMIAGETQPVAREKAMEHLERLGLKERANHIPAKLSGGEQQRIAILRALIHQPTLLLADEPTGNLDTKTAAIVFKELKSLIKKTGRAALIATHDLALAKKMDRIIKLS